jgi:hypothetical protein
MICRIMLPLPGSRYARTVVMVVVFSAGLGIEKGAQASRGNTCESDVNAACNYPSNYPTRAA